MLNMTQVVIATCLAAGVTFFTRTAPFLFFRNKTPSPGILYLQRYIPPMTMMILVIYCVKDVAWKNHAQVIPTLVGIAATAGLHVWKKNPMLSIFSGTILYMVLLRIL